MYELHILQTSNVKWLSTLAPQCSTTSSRRASSLELVWLMDPRMNHRVEGLYRIWVRIISKRVSIPFAISEWDRWFKLQIWERFSQGALRSMPYLFPYKSFPLHPLFSVKTKPPSWVQGRTITLLLHRHLHQLIVWSSFPKLHRHHSPRNQSWIPTDSCRLSLKKGAGHCTPSFDDPHHPWKP
jgi:hypothetical protein